MLQQKFYQKIDLPFTEAQNTGCSELHCIFACLATFHGLKVSVLGTQSPKQVQQKGLQIGFPVST